MSASTSLARMLRGIRPLASASGAQQISQDTRQCSAFHPLLLDRNRTPSSSTDAHGWKLFASSASRSYSTVTGKVFDNNEALVDDLMTNGLCSEAVGDLMRKVDRSIFAHTWAKVSIATCYMDTHVSIGQGQTISAPSIHAISLQLLIDHLKPGAYALDIGAGTGYIAACMGFLVGREGLAIGIERHQRIVDLADWNLVTGYPELLDDSMLGNTQIVCRDALADGNLDDLPDFDVIHVGASCTEIPPQFLAKLKPGGRMVLPIGRSAFELQTLTIVDKGLDGSISVTEDRPVKMMPLMPPFSLP